MNKYIKGILIGLCLGDGHINKKDNCLQITHSKKQLFYLEYINNLLSNIFNVPKHNLYHRIDKKHDEYTLVFGRRIFKTIRKILYKNNVKYFSKEILNYLTPQSIALWIMDDGSHCVNKRNGKIISHSFHLYTYTDIEETNNIIEYFYEKYNIRLYKIKQEPKCGIRYYLKCKTREFRKLSNLVNPFILQSMKYKILID